MTDFRQELEAAAASRGDTEKDVQTKRSRSSAAKAREHDESAHRERPALDHWSPPSQLETPRSDGQYGFRWITEYVNGTFMPGRLNQAKRQGYEFVRIDELPEGFVVDEDSKGDGLARMGGLILARIPMKFARQRKEYYAKRSKQALHGANTLQGIAGKDMVEENRGTRTLDGPAAGEALRSMTRSSV